MADEKVPEQPNVSLAAMGMSPSEFGAALLQEAENDEQKARIKGNIARVRGIRQELAECDQRLESYASWKKICEAKLAAISSGDFKFNKWGEMVFNDPKLNESETQTFDPSFVSPRNR